MTLYDLEWRDEYLIFPAVKRAVARVAKATAWGLVGVALLWLAGLLIVVVSLALCDSVSVGAWDAACLALVTCLRELLLSLLLPCLFLQALWCHLVLLAGRGLFITRWLLAALFFFAFLHTVCHVYVLATGELLLVNQFLLPALLYSVLPCVFVLNWFHMAAAPLRLRVLLLLFLLTLMGQYILNGSVLLLLLPAFGWVPLRALAQIAPLIVSLPPKE